MGFRRAPQKPGRNDELGFTLAELLIAISLVLLVTLIAIPNMPGARIGANENSAIAALREVYQAEVKYETSYPTSGFSCSLKQLGGNLKAGPPTPAQAQVLGNDLARGEKSGYLFRIDHCGTDKGQDGPTSFEVIATPKELGKTGHRGFCIDQGGEIKADPTGGPNCTQSIQ